MLSSLSHLPSRGGGGERGRRGIGDQGAKEEMRKREPKMTSKLELSQKMIEWLSLVDGACNSKFNHIKVPGELY
jgi:hypothetical protein